MKRVLIVSALVGVAGLAIAQTFLAGVRGRGVAENREGQKAEFSVEAVKVQDGDQVRVRGGFNWSTTNPDRTRGVSIRIENVERLALNSAGNVAELGGRGVMVRRGPNGPEVIRGMVSVRIEDNRPLQNPDPAAAPDRLAVSFSTQNSTNPFVWRGDVKRGDIQIRRPDAP